MSWGDWIGLATLLVSVAGAFGGIAHRYLRGMKSDLRASRRNTAKLRRTLDLLSTEVRSLKDDHKELRDANRDVWNHITRNRDILSQHGERLAKVEQR